MLMVTWGLPKDESFGERIFIPRHNFGSNNRCRYFILGTTYFFFDVPQIWFCCLISFQQNMGIFAIFRLKFSVKKRSIDFCNDFIFILLCEFSIVSKNKEMKCNSISRFFNYILKYKFWLYEITMIMMF